MSTRATKPLLVPSDPLRGPGKKAVPDLLPARMLNEFVYCPRLFYYEWVQGVFRASADTVDGQAHHSRVHTEPGALPAASALAEAGIQARSVELSSERLGLTARLDLIETAEGDGGGDGASDRPIVTTRPIDYKRGRPAEADGLPAAWPADRAQIAVQALVLRDNGYACEEGVLYYAATKQRVRVPITDSLVTEILVLLDQARELAGQEQIPPPLEDSPKCPRCSLVGICLRTRHPPCRTAT